MARRSVDAQSAKGVDFIKTGDTVDHEEFLAIVAQARQRGLAVAGHLPVAVSALEAARAGQRSIEHFGSALFHGVLIACSDDETELQGAAQRALDAARTGGASPNAILLRAPFIKWLLESYNAAKARALFVEFARNGTWQVPTLVAIKDIISNGQRALLASEDRVAGELLWLKYGEMIRGMRAAGVRFMAGTDVPIDPGGSALHDELRLLVEAGLSPMEALQAATRDPAEYLGVLTNEGTVEVGKVADLVLLDADPLADITNVRRVAAVVLRGRLISGTNLQSLR